MVVNIRAFKQASLDDKEYQSDNVKRRLYVRTYLRLNYGKNLL